MRGRKNTLGKRLGVHVSVAAAALNALTATAGAADPAQAPNRVHTTTPIKHVIVVIAENSSFDHAFGTFQPRAGETIHNLLSTGIVKADGTPGPNAKKATQFTVTPQPQYFISAPAVSKTPFATLPPPDLNGVPQAPSATVPPFLTTAEAAAAEPHLRQRATRC
jgi:phospholipase C